MKTSALRPRPQVERQEAEHAGQRCRERKDEHRVVRMNGDGVDREERRTAIAASVAASPSMLSSRLNAFVIPTSQRSASAP